jgi:hypothetical protein
MLSEKLHVTAKVKMPIGAKFCYSLFQTKEHICQIPNDLSPSPLLSKKIRTSSFEAKAIFAFVQKSTDFKLKA